MGNQVSTVYALLDSEGRVRYVGQTATALKVRLGCHISEAKNKDSPSTTKVAWIREMLSAKEQPAIMLVESCESSKAIDRENHWINKYRSKVGVLLTNVLEMRPPSWRGKRHSPETIAKMRIAAKERLATPASRRKLSRAKKAIATPEWKLMMSERMREWHRDRKKRVEAKRAA